MLARSVALALSLGANLVFFDVARAQLGGGGGGLGGGQSSQNGSGGGGQAAPSPSFGGIDLDAIANGDFSSVQAAVADWKSRNEAGECGGDSLMGAGRAAAAGALATTFSGGGYPVMDIGSILRLMAQLKESQEQSDILCGTRRDHSAITDGVDRAQSGWRSVIPDGVTVDDLLSGRGTGTVLSAWFDRFVRRDEVYRGEILSFDNEEMVRRRNSISGGMAAQQAILDQISQREEAMNQLTVAHQTARTAAAKQDIANRYREEQNKVGILRGQMQAINARAEMEHRNSEQRIQENNRREVDGYHARLLAARAARFTLE